MLTGWIITLSLCAGIILLIIHNARRISKLNAFRQQVTRYEYVNIRHNNKLLEAQIINMYGNLIFIKYLDHGSYNYTSRANIYPYDYK